ncbi:hypothetical protein AB4Y30_11390 [Ornithinibacillus sp. 4-3]|uniref:Uncharacterized protein n=1 Tax=Ornithinibacillus sp. 4-3 TaxID=3231488 RepID=A0AB39HHS8_9BACI
MGKIPKRGKARKNVITDTTPDLSSENFTFDFRDNRWLLGVKKGKFTNKLKDVESYSKSITLIMAKIIPEIQAKSKDIQQSMASDFHCHPIEQGHRSYITVLAVMREIYGHSFEKTIQSNEQIYQIGVSGGIRIITLRNKQTNIIRPLFIDYHHLAYPNPKYSHTDYIKQSFCPIANYL